MRDRELGRILRGSRRVAMQYSARNEIPTVARVDAGAVELVRAMGPEVVSSAELVAQVESVLSADELASQAVAAELVAQAQDATAQEAARRVRAGNPATERELRGFAVLRSTSAPSYPVPEQRRAFVGYESEDGQVRGQSGQFVSTLSPAEVARFYRAQLARRGFVERPESAPGLLAFVNGREQISVAMQSLEEERGAAVFVTRLEGAQ